jgi:hypothetical protein
MENYSLYSNFLPSRDALDLVLRVKFGCSLKILARFQYIHSFGPTARVHNAYVGLARDNLGKIHERVVSWVRTGV